MTPYLQEIEACKNNAQGNVGRNKTGEQPDLGMQRGQLRLEMELHGHGGVHTCAKHCGPCFLW